MIQTKEKEKERNEKAQKLLYILILLLCVKRSCWPPCVHMNVVICVVGLYMGMCTHTCLINWFQTCC
jgi:hypothetical protein